MLDDVQNSFVANAFDSSAVDACRMASGPVPALTPATRRSQRGFTLIELMIVAIIAIILSTVAVPMYRNYVTRAKIPDATSGVAAKRVQMEQYFQDNRTYVGATACNNDTSTSRYFTFTCSNVTATTYRITASGGNNGTGDQSMAGFYYYIDQSNNKSSQILSPPFPDKSWAGNNGCWITKINAKC